MLRKSDIYAQTNKIEHFFTPCAEINSECIKVLRLRFETTELLEESIWVKLQNIGLGNPFLDRTSHAETTKGKIYKWDYIKLAKMYLHIKGKHYN